jgi:ABC-type glycerol-3-phosphate transport system permease component
MAISVDSLLGQLKELDNDHIIEFLGQMQIAEYIHNPWFLGGMVALAVFCLVFKWRLLLATIVGLTGLAWLVNYTVAQGTEVSEGLQSNSLIFFIGGGVLIVVLMIYLVFIKEE